GPASPFPPIAAPQVPEPAQRGGQPDPELGMANALAPGERGAEARPLALEAVEPGELARSPQLRLNRLGQSGPERSVPAISVIHLAGRGQPLPRERPDRLQHPETRRSRGVGLPP